MNRICQLALSCRFACQGNLFTREIALARELCSSAIKAAFKSACVHMNKKDFISIEMNI